MTDGTTTVPVTLSDGSVAVWSLETGKPQSVWSHGDYTPRFAVDNGRRRLVLVGISGEGFSFDPFSSTAPTALQFDANDGMWAVAEFAIVDGPDHSYLAGRSIAGVLRVLDATNYQHVFTTAPVTASAVASLRNAPVLVTTHAGRKVMCVRDLRSGTLMTEIDLPLDEISATLFPTRLRRRGAVVVASNHVVNVVDLTTGVPRGARRPERGRCGRHDVRRSGGSSPDQTRAWPVGTRDWSADRARLRPRRRQIQHIGPRNQDIWCSSSQDTRWLDLAVGSGDAGADRTGSHRRRQRPTRRDRDRNRALRNRRWATCRD